MCIRSSTAIAPVVPSSSPAACASSLLGSLCRQTITASHSSSPSEVATARTRVPSPVKPSTRVPSRSVTPRLTSESWTGSATSGSSTSESTQGPSSTKSTCRPRWPRLPAISTPSGARADHDHALEVVELLVERHRRADVLDVVQPVEVGAGHVGLLPHEARADDQLVEPLVGVAGGDRPAVEVDVGDGRLHAHVEPVLDVALDGGEEQVLELRDLAAVHERDAAGRVGDVGELGEQRHLEVRVQAPGDGRGGRARAAAADHDQPLGHVTSRRGEPSPDVVRYSTAGGVASVLETQQTRRARAASAASSSAGAAALAVTTTCP